MNFLPKRYGTLFFLLFAIVFSSGCVLVPGAIIAGGGVAYIKGDLKTKEPVEFDKVWFAVLEVVEQQEFEIIRKESSASKALVEAKLGYQDKILSVTVKYYRPEITDLSIRIGILGDEEESRRILELIHEKLR